MPTNAPALEEGTALVVVVDVPTGASVADADALMAALELAAVALGVALAPFSGAFAMGAGCDSS